MKILPGSIAEKLSTVPKAAVVQPALLVGRQLRCNGFDGDAGRCITSAVDSLQATTYSRSPHQIKCIIFNNPSVVLYFNDE